MLKNYLKIAVRNLLKQRGYSLINIAGLAMGMSCCLLILTYVWDELNHDRFHEKSDRIYRLYLDARINDKDLLSALSCMPLASTLRLELPGIEAATRIRHVGNFTVRYEDKTFNEERLFFADSTLFEVFSFTMLAGDAHAALTRPHTVVITDEMARKYFGEVSPLGKTLLMDGREQYEVTAVVKKFSTSSHWQSGRVAGGVFCHATVAGEFCLLHRSQSRHVPAGRRLGIDHCVFDGELSCDQSGAGESG